MIKQHKLKKLLEESCEKYYWLGFLLADGHFEDKRLSVSVSIQDLQHLEKFKTFLESSAIIGRNLSTCNGKKYEYCKLSIMDSFSIPLLKQQYNISNRKTYEPPNLLNIPDDFLFCLFIGFIDGDGSIQKQTNRPDCKITVKCHKSWSSVLSLFNSNVKETKDGYSYISFTKTSVIKEFKQKAIQFNLPLLERKWDLVDLNYNSRYDVALTWQSKAIALYKEGTSLKDIAIALSKKYITIYMALKRGGYLE